MSVEILGLPEWQAALKAAPRKAKDSAKKVVKKTALEIKRDAKALVRGQLASRGYRGGGSYLPHYALSIDFELKDSGMAAEIGPDPGVIQGRFGRGVEFGSSHTAPMPHMLPAADKQFPLFERFLKDAVTEALK